MQLINVLKYKFHHARVTQCDVDYIGSIGISCDLMEAIGLLENELVHVWAVDQHVRIVTYTIALDEPGMIQLNGGAAQYFKVDDRVVIAAFIHDTPFEPRVAVLDENNRIVA